MYPTLRGSQHVMLVSNLNYTPERGMTLSCCSKETFTTISPIVKRIIATGGDAVDIDPVTRRTCSVNGEVLR